MNDIEHTNRQIHSSTNPTVGTDPTRRTQRQQSNPSPEPRSITTTGNQLAPLDVHHSYPTTNKSNTASAHMLPTSSVVVTPGAGNSNSLPGHQSGRSKLTNLRLIDQQVLNISDNLNSTGGGDHDITSSSPSTLSRKKNLSTSDLDPSERKKQAALVKVEAKLEKAQRLHQKAQQSVEQEISDFLRVTTLPNTNNEINSSRTSSASFDKRIRTLQDTKKELEKKITNYQSDLSRIQAGEIPHNYTSSKDIFSNIKSTAVKVAGGSLKHRSSHNNDQTTTISTPNTAEHVTPFHYPESDSHYHHSNLSTTLATPTANTSTSGAVNNNQNLLTPNQHSNTLEPAPSSLSSSASNEIGNSQFYIDSTHEHVFDNDKSNRKHDVNVPVDVSTIHDHDKSPSSKRRLTDDSNIESNDRISDHSVDDRYTSKRNTSTTTTAIEYQQLNTKIDSMQKLVDRYDIKINEMQKQIDSLATTNENQHEENERLNNELTDLTDLHQIEMLSVKTDLKNLENRLSYKFNEYWNEILDKIEKIDTRTAKVEQTQTHSLETEENTHRIISKLVNILLTVFAIILLILSTIKNLIQSRIHAMTLLILALIWITFHYLPPNYFHTSFLKNFSNMFKRTS